MPYFKQEQTLENDAVEGFQKNVDQFHGIAEVIDRFASIIVLISLLASLTGCGPDQRLRTLDARIKALDGTMKPGEVRDVALPTIKSGEWLIAISGQYGGLVCSPSPLSNKAAQQVSLDYGASESSPAFLLIVSGDRVQSSVPLSIANSPLVIQSLEKDHALCALIAGPKAQSLVAECMALPSSSKAPAPPCEVVLRTIK